MLRKIVLTAMMVLAVPTVSVAQREEHPSRERPGPGNSEDHIPAARQDQGNFEDHVPVDRQDQGNSENHVPADRQGALCIRVAHFTRFTSLPSSIHAAGPTGAG